MPMKAKKKIIGSIVILAILGIFLVVGLVINKPKTHKYNEDDIFVESTLSEGAEKIDSKLVTVCIKGEVSKPGVYRLKAGSIVEDLIRQAGGFTSEANTDSKLNLARKLKDEDYVYVDRKIDPAAAAESTSVQASKGIDDGKIDINSATLEELDKIPGVGPVTAQKIIDYREKYGTFGSIEDLKKIGGIGDKTIDKFRDKVDIR
jgi:competence protein ComEA